MAGVALERALAADRTYRLADLMRKALSACVPPEQLRAIVVGVTGDGVLPGA
jgi:hypothetical protein